MSVEAGDPGPTQSRQRLAIIGGGSSGLICLKMAKEFLPDWEIVCYEKSDSIQGCWGNPYPGFVSTSTRYTTQFSCFPVADASINKDGGASREEFFREGEYGQYLESFADRFDLRSHIRLNLQVENLERDSDGLWNLKVVGSEADKKAVEQFDSVVICTGLAAKAKPIACSVPQLAATDINRLGGLEQITNNTIVVIGGGESAVDYADRLARKELNNQVYLSLHSGVRVSPRYHAVRGVPSDFLRNRLMLSVHPDIRNYLGQVFVEWRIKYQRTFEKLFPSKNVSGTKNSSKECDEANQRRKHWTLELTLAAKDDLFNMFHNKSDDFLGAVGEERIKIVGPPVDKSYSQFHPFQTAARKNDNPPNSSAPLQIEPDLIVPAIGYQSALGKLTNEKESLGNFFLGCTHKNQTGLHLVGFARPIIGNIPSISEMQARFVCGLIAGRHQLPPNHNDLHEPDLVYKRKRFEKLNHDAVYPVEMFPYCDRLAAMMKLPVGKGISLGPSWWKTRLTPATTMHYFPANGKTQQTSVSAPIYMPPLLILFILFMKPTDWAYKTFRRLTGWQPR